jgi:hypothetical protein
MIKFSKNAVNGYKGLLIDYMHIKQDKPSTNLVVMFPGRGYTVQGPLFHYSTGVYLNKGFDILQVNYDYTTKEAESMSLEEEMIRINEDVNAVIDEVLTEHAYDHFVLLGKSIGTIALSSVVDRAEFKLAKCIWLTPLFQLDKVFESMKLSRQPGLCIIGEKDPCYIQDRYDEIKAKDTFTSFLIPGTDHSLNYSNSPLDSIDVLKKVITDISLF